MIAKSLSTTIFATIGLLTLISTSSAQNRAAYPLPKHYRLPCDGLLHVLDRYTPLRVTPVIVTSDPTNPVPIEILPLDLNGAPLLFDRMFINPGQALMMGGGEAYQLAVITPFLPGRMYTGMIYADVTVNRNNTGKCGEYSQIMLDPKMGTWTIDVVAEDGGQKSKCPVQVRVAIDTGRKDALGRPITEYIPVHEIDPAVEPPPAKQVDLPFAGYPADTKYLWIEVGCYGSQLDKCRWTIKLTWTPPR